LEVEVAVLVFFQRMLMHYRVGLFRALAERTGDLVLVHGLPPRSLGYGGAIRDVHSDFGFQRLVVKNHWWNGERLVWQNFLPAFATGRSIRAAVIEESPRMASNFALIALCRARGIPVLGFGIGWSIHRTLDAPGIANRVRRAQIASLDGYIAYGERGRPELAKLLGPEKVFIAQNTLDTDELIAARRAAEQEPVSAIKKRLGLRSRNILLFSGRLHADKEPETVIRLAQLLCAQHHETGVVFLGGGPELSRLKQMADGIVETHFLGENNYVRTTAPYFLAADAMVMPRSLGLGINHAFSMGLPVLTQEPGPDHPSQPPEADELEHGVTGFMVPSGDLGAMAAAAVRIFDNRDAFRAQTIRKLETNLSLSRWVTSFDEAVCATVRSRTDRELRKA
jgi:glycosyltransferase involved in cell wall biosynthesis